MKRNAVTIVVGGLLLLVFVVLLFTFQVRETEVAVVTTFDKPTTFHKTPGLKFKWPRPIQKVYTFDKRVQDFEDTLEPTLTRDGYSLLVSVYVGWSIANPELFFSRFPSGTVAEAQPRLEDLIRSTKQAVVGGHPFSHFVSVDLKQLQLDQIEKSMLDAIRPGAQTNYGIDVHSIGIKRLNLPESVTAKVFDRMKAERQREIERLRAEGDAQATIIKSKADRERDEILATAAAKATSIRGEADAAAAKHFAVFQKNPELATLLLKLSAMQEILKDKATLVLDERTAPFDLLGRPAPLTTVPKK